METLIAPHPASDLDSFDPTIDDDATWTPQLQTAGDGHHPRPPRHCIAGGIDRRGWPSRRRHRIRSAALLPTLRRSSAA